MTLKEKEQTIYKHIMSNLTDSDWKVLLEKQFSLIKIGDQRFTRVNGVKLKHYDIYYDYITHLKSLWEKYKMSYLIEKAFNIKSLVNEQMLSNNLVHKLSVTKGLTLGILRDGLVGAISDGLNFDPSFIIDSGVLKLSNDILYKSWITIADDYIRNFYFTPVTVFIKKVKEKFTIKKTFAFDENKISNEKLKMLKKEINQIAIDAKLLIDFAKLDKKIWITFWEQKSNFKHSGWFKSLSKWSSNIKYTTNFFPGITVDFKVFESKDDFCKYFSENIVKENTFIKLVQNKIDKFIK